MQVDSTAREKEAEMTNLSEQCIRSILALDDKIDMTQINRAIAIMKGNPNRASDLCRVVSFKEAARIMEVNQLTIHGYIRKGYLTPVLGIGRRAIGINGNSLDAFQQRRIVHKGKPIQRDR